MICARCGASVLMLFHGRICATCNSKAIAKELQQDICYDGIVLTRKKRKRKRKKKCRHNVENNVLRYLEYVATREVGQFNKRDFSIGMGIPITSVNYLIKILKTRGYIDTGGYFGHQHYIPVLTFKTMICSSIVIIGKGVCNVEFIEVIRKYRK